MKIRHWMSAKLILLVTVAAWAVQTYAGHIPVEIDGTFIFIPCADVTGNAGIASANVSIGARSVVADGSGNYRLSCVVPGAYTVTPSRADYAFSPASKPISIVSGNTAQQTVNFSASRTCRDITGNVGIAGATVAVDGRTAVSTASGSFAFSCVGLGSKVFTPSLADYSFSPASRTVALGSGSADPTVVNFAATRTCGLVTGTTGVAGVTVTGGGRTTTSNASGSYTLCLSVGTHTITPSRTEYAFTPASAQASIASNATQLTLNFSANRTCRDVTGNVGIAGATVTGDGRSTVADATGRYTFGCVGLGSKVFTPTLANYTFSPASQTISLNSGSADPTVVNFAAARTCRNITGNVGIAGATVTGDGRTTVADAAGNYAFTCVGFGSKVFTPTLFDYTFSPASQTISLSSGSADPTVVNFAATRNCRNISGSVGVAGATITGDGRSTVSDASGNYAFSCVGFGSKVFTPTLPDYIFSPASYSISLGIGSANPTVLNFTATRTCGLVTGTTGIAGATITGGGKTTTANASGAYSLCLAIGTHTITPSAAGRSFLPVSSPVTVASSSGSYVKNFTVTPIASGSSTPFVRLDDVVVQSYELRGGASGQVQVIEVDTSMLARRPVRSGDPYWYRYYRSFWGNGTGTSHLSTTFVNADNRAAELAYGEGLDVTQWLTVANGGASSTNFSFVNSDEFASRIPHTTWRNGTQPRQFLGYYLEKHFLRSIGSSSTEKWVPGWTPGLNPYYMKRNSTTPLYLGFRMELYRKLYTFSGANPSSVPNGVVWDSVHPGEVEADGWGIVPLDDYVQDSTGRGVAWAFVVPKGARVNIRTSGASCPRTDVVGETPVEGATPCIIDPQPWFPLDPTIYVRSGQCLDAAGIRVKVLGDTCRFLADGAYSNPGVVRMAAKVATVAFGGDLLASNAGVRYDLAGTLHVVNPDGTNAIIAMDQAQVILRAYGLAFMNGSINSPTDAISNATRIAAATGLPVVMIYMAQTAIPNSGDDLSKAYPRDSAGSQVAERAAMRELLAATRNVETTWIGHSWSGHIVLGEAKNEPRTNVVIFNPAHLPFGATNDRYIQDIQSFTGKSFRIVAGATDWVSQNAGQWWDDTSSGSVVTWNSGVRNALSGTYKQQIVVGERRADGRYGFSGNPVGHGMEEIVRAGGASYIPTRPVQSVW